MCMPNWFFSEVIFEVQEKDVNLLKLFKNKIIPKTDKKEIIKFNDFMFNFGKIKNTKLKGSITEFFDFEKQIKLKVITWAIRTDTAWSPQMDFWFEIVKKFNKENNSNIQIYYISEEDNFDVYETNDVKKRYYSEKWYIDSFNDKINSGYYKNKKDIVEQLNIVFHLNLTIKDNLQEKLIKNDITDVYIHKLNVNKKFIV